MTPTEASLKKNREQVRNNLYTRRRNKNPKFKVGDTVRLTKCKGTFEKGYKQNYTPEVFRIKEVLSDGIPYYHLVDMNAEDILN